MNAFARLRSKGHRITNQREIILNSLKLHPQSAEEIHQNIDKKVDLASVYRTLNILAKNGILKVVNFGDRKKRYELANEKNHHHHFICNNCKSVKDIFSEMEERLISDIETRTQLKVQTHSLELFGLCQNCA